MGNPQLFRSILKGFYDPFFMANLFSSGFIDAMHFCNKNNIYSASDFKAIVQQHIKASIPQQKSDIHILNPLSGHKLDKNVQPEKSQIEDYQELFKK